MRTWIFQGNPEIFDIDGYLSATAGLITWRVARYADQIAPGDSVYIWRSQGQDASLAGVVAEGIVAEHPKIQKDDPISAGFWRQVPEQDEAMRVRIRLNRIASKREILKREWMKDDSALKNLLILRQAAGTNFPVEESEAWRLGQLWRKAGTDWGRDEVVAALLLYEQLRNKPISKVAESPVEQLAQQIGRAPTGVYNKLMNLRAIDPRDARKGFEGGSKVDQMTWDEFFDLTASTIDIQRLNAENDRLWGGGIQADAPADKANEAEEKRLGEKPLEWLLNQYSVRPPNLAPKRRPQASSVYDRDPLVVALRKCLANFRCEVDSCQSDQFWTDAGDLFVEVHHLIPLAEGGPDTLENTVAVCPTHHRFLHHGKDRAQTANQLTIKRQRDQLRYAG